LILQKPMLINQFFKDGFALNYWDAYFCTTNSEWRGVLQCLSFYVDFAETYFDHFFKGFVHWTEMDFVLTGTLSEPDSPLSCWNPFLQLANYLRDQGVKKGDAVAIYMPMLVELPIAMLACARIGAVHSVRFVWWSCM
jgi:hypothetical protein